MQSLVFVTILLAAALRTSSEKISGRIIGGSDAPEGKYPYQVSLRKTGHFCSGSIINNRWILTAGHCLHWTKPEAIKVLVGTSSLSEGGQTYQADFLLEYPLYTVLLYVNDIGLIHVSENIVFNDQIQPVKLPKSDFTGNDYPVTLSGWGRLSLGGPIPDRLQEIDLQVVSRLSCRRTFPFIRKSHICTFTKKGEGICYGDSGGPLTANGIQVGIVSFGRPCGEGYPDVYTRVWNYVDWINKSIKKYS